jgi:hypothetical protein
LFSTLYVDFLPVAPVSPGALDSRRIRGIMGSVPVPHPGTPITIPLAAHAAMWTALAGWIVLLVRRRRTASWPCSPRFGAVLVPGCLFVDAGALVAAVRWPTAASNSFILALLWLAMLFSVTAYFALRAHGDDDDGDDDSEELPEPPWWPDFERQFRDYSRRGPRKPAAPPKAPAGASS